MLINAECALLLWGLYRLLPHHSSGDSFSSENRISMIIFMNLKHCHAILFSAINGLFIPPCLRFRVHFGLFYVPGFYLAILALLLVIHHI
jgi:hypothetical protein